MASVNDRWYVIRDGKRVRSSYTGSRRYQVRWREYPGGPQKTESFIRKTDADDHLVAVSHSMKAGTYVSPDGGREAFDHYWTTWRASRVDLRDSTQARDESYYRTHVEPKFKGVPLGVIDRRLLREWVAELVDVGLAPKTVRHAFHLVAQTLAAAADDKLIARNPAERMKGLPKVVTHEMRCFTPAEIALLEATIDKRYRVWLRTAVGTGLRLGELSGLRAGRVDLLRRRVTVAETMVEVHGVVSYGPPKTKAGLRQVPISAVLAARLTDHLAGLEPGDLAFTAPEGGPIRASLFRRRIWQPACVAAGLGKMVKDADDEDGIERYVGPRIHDLRHTAVSWWIASKADPKQVATWAGHSSVATVMDRYGHLLPDREEHVMDSLDELANVRAPKGQLATLRTS